MVSLCDRGLLSSAELTRGAAQPPDGALFGAQAGVRSQGLVAAFPQGFGDRLGARSGEAVDYAALFFVCVDDLDNLLERLVTSDHAGVQKWLKDQELID